MVSPAIISAGLTVLGGVLGGRGGKAEAKRTRRALQAQTKEVEKAREFAERQFQEFQPIIRQFSNFFQQVSLEDIQSGAIAARAAEPAIRDINRLAQVQQSELSREAGRRGLIGSGIVAQGVRDIGRQRAGSIADVLERSRRQEVLDRFQFAGFGVGAGQNLIAAQQGVAATAGQQAGLLAQQGLAAQQFGLQAARGIGQFFGSPTGLAFSEALGGGLSRFFAGSAGQQLNPPGGLSGLRNSFGR